MGVGEWKTRIHSVAKPRTWPQLDLGVNEATREIVTAVVTTNNISDDQVFDQLLDGVEGEITQVSGDGAYDQHKCDQKASQLGAKTTIPPRKNAVQHRNMATVEGLIILEMKISDAFAFVGEYVEA